MMTRLLFMFLAVTVGPAAALANGAIAERKTGGLVFKQSDSIAITREDIKVSLDRIGVDYRYRSEAPAAQKVAIAFPMPQVPVGDDPGSLRDILQEDKPPEDYMNFEVKVDGKAVTTTPFARALLKDRDISDNVLKAGLPFHMMVEDTSATLAKVPKPFLDELIALGAVLKSDEVYSPQWDYQVAFEWQQEFPPGETRVSISYVPLAGYPSDIGDNYEKGPLADAACVDDEVRAAIAKRKAAGSGYYEVASVGYVLTTAKYWKGPIGSFNLTVEKPDEKALVAFCPKEAKKVSPIRFEWRTKDFTPKADLSVVFYTFQEAE